MNQCKEIRAQITFYLDDELQESERTAIEHHLRDCEACREIFDAELRFLEAIRASYPLHQATPKLRARVEEILDSAPAVHTASPALRSRVRRSLRQFSPNASGLVNTRRAVA